MNIKGTIINILPSASGISKDGKQWNKQEYILQTDGEKYPKTICFAVMGDNIAGFAIQYGRKYIVDIDISSKEYNGRWYTSITAWRVTPA